MCIGGEALPSSLSVLRTLRSVLTGSLEPLTGITRKVCYMYYTDVFVGTDNNIDNLKKALEAELGGSVDSVDLTDLNAELDALASGLKSFIGYSGGSVSGSGIGKNGLTAQNFSSYNGASWPECKQSGTCSCSSSCHPSASSPSCHGSCCDNCDVKKAAKIFLGMLPCLYYALKYLYKQCKGGGGWKDFLISDHDKPLRHFLIGMGYNVKTDLKDDLQGSQIPGLLSSLFTGSKPLQSLYEKSKNYFTSRFTSPLPSSGSSVPSTVRDILLWLYGLPFTPGFKALLNHCKDPLNSVNFVNFDKFKTYLFDSCFLSPFVLGVIEGSQSDEEALKGFPPYKSEISKFSYPEDPYELLDLLFDYVRKMFVPLKFLKFQCERTPAQAGWQNCFFGKNCKLEPLPSASSGSSSVSSSGCSCPNSKTYLCTGSSGSSHSSSSCPHPLQRFLTDSQSSVSKSLFQPPEGFPPMGFSPDKLSSPGRHGHVLHAVLKVFCDDGFYPLTRLLKSLICISRAPPETLGEFFVFFQKFKDSPVFSSKLKDFADYASKEPGTPDGQKFTNALKDALEALKGSRNSHSGSHPSDLKSLYDCSTSTCGPYLNPLTGDVYKNFIDNFDETYLSWICYLPKDFKTLLEEFKQKFSSCCSSGSSCTSIVKCPCALPRLYAQGFTFASPKGLNGKKCSDFIAQLEKVLEDPQSTLLSLIAEIESFLWSIRLPFFFGFLYVWFFVLSYFFYVILIKLDTFHTGSHLHLPRSFKILPSTLFSDASSKLKDLSYFTL